MNIRIHKKKEVSTKVDIKDFIFELLESCSLKGIKERNEEITCQCPFHMNKKNFSTFSVRYTPKYSERRSEENYFYHCFSCGESGDIIRLISFLKNCTYSRALKLFNKKVVQAGVTVNGLERAMLAHRTRLKAFGNLPIANLPEPAVSQKRALNYIESRSEEAHNIINVKYVMRKYGLYCVDKGRYIGRLIMPLYDLDGRTIGMDDRAMFDTTRKSLHESNSKFNMMLGGIYQAIDKSVGVLVEGMFDLLQTECAIRKLGLEDYGVVDLTGTGFSEDRAKLLLEVFDRIIILLDNEPEAIKRSNKIYRMLMDDMEVYNHTYMYHKEKDPGILCLEEFENVLKIEKKSKILLMQERINRSKPCENFRI